MSHGSPVIAGEHSQGASSAAVATAAGTAGVRRGFGLAAAILVAALLFWAMLTSCFVADVTEFGVVTRFGRIVRVIPVPGLYFKAPFDTVVRIDRRLLLSRSAQAEFLSEDKKNIVVDGLATWRVADPKRYLETLGTRPAAEVRIADIVQGEIGAVMGRYAAAAFITPNALASRYAEIVLEIRDRVANFVGPAYGIALLNVDIRHLSLSEQNKEHVFERMKAERGKIAAEHRSAGELEAQRITAAADHEKSDIEADAYAKAQHLKAVGDAEAARIYAGAFSRDPGFYKFLRTLQAYQQFLDDKTTLFLPAEAEALGILGYGLRPPAGEGAAPAGSPALGLRLADPASRARGAPHTQLSTTKPADMPP